MSQPSTEPYPEVEGAPSFPDIEASVIERWKQEGTFQASIDRRSTDREFVFYDGPPFANGQVHFGHLLTGFVKDTVPRHRTMNGERVERRFGWDCHGLPIEMEAEQTLGVSGRVNIIEYGVDRFNEFCRSLVGTTTEEWEYYVTRQARWVDMVNDYKTMDLPYMESVMWALKRLYDKGLMYEGYRVLPYCWECETPLSNFETRLDDAYRDRQDPSLTVMFELDGSNERLLVWTTTPWTLPSNLAVAVGPDLDYAVFEEASGPSGPLSGKDGKQRYIVGEATVGNYEKELAGATRVGTMRGSELVGRRYTPLFPYFADAENAFRVLAADFVTTEDGTGVVHIAPGFGEDDQRLSEANGIAVVAPVDERGRFTADVPDYEGLQVFEANAAIARDLKARGVVVRHDTYVHSYPHCWRTDTPLIYRAVSSWFIRVTDFKHRMQELNQEISWVPEHVRDGAFGKWLEGARDWSISRNRFWGSPIPVWKSDDPAYPRIDVYGSLDELERDFGVRPTDLHRPGIDELIRPNPDDPTGRSTMRRVEDVLDCWFESGSMPFAQVHYPFENQDWFESHFPGDFIVEYVGQTRGWFYTLHVLATALFDKPAFRSCLAHGILLGEDGQKLSKRLKNYPDPGEVFDTVGADAMRWALSGSAVMRGGDMVVDRQHLVEPVRRVLLPIWNGWHFLSLYANAAGRRGRVIERSPNLLDRYVMAKSRQLVEEVGAGLDIFDLSGACAAVQGFVESLNNWYIRRSRDRFWAGDPDAIDTLHTVLVRLCRTAAPLLPLITEHLYGQLTGEGSVHLTDWPSSDELPIDPEGDEIVAAMDLARDVCSAAASVRKANRLRHRLPLRSLTVATDEAEKLAAYADLIADEVNVKVVEMTTDVDAAGEIVLQVVPSVLGPRVGSDVQKIIRAVKAGEWERTADGGVEVAGRRLADDEYTLNLAPRAGTASAPLVGGRGLVVLDVEVTPELAAEGMVRDVARGVNEIRRERGLNVSDRIHLVIDPGHHHDLAEAIEHHEGFLRDETLALELVVNGPVSDGNRAELADGRAYHVGLHVVG